MKAVFIVFAILAVAAWFVDAVTIVKCSEEQEEDKIEYHPHPCKCNTYYVCMGTDPVPMPCPRGLQWNRVKDICDWPNKAKCRPEPDCPKDN
ncbi:peritrophin-1 [Megalopta genalis]|uniref:peritrophin-1 n=1 Tax=Megalopta genalis TaxID=115081 RepID=UPI003FD31252